MNPAGLAAHPHSESSYREEGASVHVDAAFNISSHHKSQSVHGKYRPVARLEHRLCAPFEENLAHAPMPVAAHHDDHSEV